MGKLVEVIGPSFGGKTYLISKLVHDFHQFEVIGYEQHYVPSSIKLGYDNFYFDIMKRLCRSDVISESVYGHANNKYVNVVYPQYLSILCMPSIEEHHTRYINFCNKYGTKQGELRTGGYPLQYIRDIHRIGYKGLVFDGNNYDEIKGAIEEWL